MSTAHLPDRLASLDFALAARAALQGGVVSARDARAVGAQTGDIRQLISAGRWSRLRRGVYGDTRYHWPGPAAAHAQTAAALLAAMHDDVVLSHSTAARLLGLPVPRSVSDDVRLTRRPPRHGNAPAGGAVHVRDFDPANVVRLHGLPVLAGADVVFDCCSDLSAPDALAVADAALRSGVTDRAALAATLTERYGLPGMRGAGHIAAMADPRSESWLESVSRWWMAEARLPAPELQVELASPEGLVRLDFLFVQEQTVGEADGRMKYEGPDGVDALVREKRREEWLRDAYGFEVVRWMASDLRTRSTRAAWVERLRRAFDRSRRAVS